MTFFLSLVCTLWKQLNWIRFFLKIEDSRQFFCFSKKMVDFQWHNKVTFFVRGAFWFFVNVVYILSKIAHFGEVPFLARWFATNIFYLAWLARVWWNTVPAEIIQFGFPVSSWVIRIFVVLGSRYTVMQIFFLLNRQCRFLSVLEGVLSR